MKENKRKEKKEKKTLLGCLMGICRDLIFFDAIWWWDQDDDEMMMRGKEEGDGLGVGWLRR